MKIFLSIFSFLLFFSCQNERSIPTSNYLKISGKTMGTTYHITYEDEKSRSFKTEMDSILVAINNEVSTYEKDSEITRFNQAEDFEEIKIGTYFKAINEASEWVFRKTDGYFDPTIMPLVNYWGFGYTAKKPVLEVDSLAIKELKKTVGWKNVYIGTYEVSPTDDDLMVMILSDTIYKWKSNIQLDFSAIAKGYAVDVLSEFFEEKNIKNYLVEVGGELRTKGKNPKGKLWTTAINTPRINVQLNEYEAIIKMDNKAIATSGNYRNFYEVNGDWYGHEIDPKTGFPEKSNLLSVSVMAESCMYADAYATAFMVMGLEKSKVLVNELEGIDAFFIFANEAGGLEYFYTNGFEGKILE